MVFKRGKNLQDLELSGPQCKNLFNQTDKLVDRLNLRNAWAHCTNHMYPDLHPLIRPERCTSFAFVRFRRELILELDSKDGLWELSARCVAAAPMAPPPDAPPDPVDGSPTGGPSASPPSNASAPPERAGDDDDNDERPRTPTQPPKRRRRRKSSLDRILCRTRRLARRVSETPRFRHTVSQIQDRVEHMRIAAGRLHALAGALVRLANTRVAAIRNALEHPGEAVDTPYVAYLERRVIEVAPGFSLVLHTFVQEPNWESWLFGKPIEDEQLVA